MPRRVRIDIPGYYHIINRGVEKRVVFMCKEDKDKFLEILNNEFKLYKVILHCYILMDNHYHLLIQTNKSNLSDVMRQVNSKYAMYFNKKYKRVGHLWQDRFKSYYIDNEIYLNILFNYFELNPVSAKIVNKAGIYYRSFLYDILNNTLIDVSKKSLFLKYTKERLYKLIDIIDIDILETKIKEIQKIQINQKSYDKKKSLEYYYEYTNDKDLRNKYILSAYKNGFKQKEIATFFKISPSLVSKILKQTITDNVKKYENY